MAIFALFALSLLFGDIFATSFQDIHKIMTNLELEYYFGEEVPDYQVVYLPTVMKRSSQRYMDDAGFEDIPIVYGFDAFGSRIDLQLKRNNALVAPNFKVHRRVFAEGEPEILEFDDDLDCHYIHNNENIIAAMSMCQDESIHGLVIMDNSTFEIRPLSPRLKSFVKLQEALTAENDENEEESANKIPHIIKRATLDAPILGTDFRILPIDNLKEELLDPEEYNENDNEIWWRSKRNSKVKYTIEVALFFDEAGYRIFSPYLNHNDKEIRDMLLAYMNGVQALYHHPSLGTSVELTLVRLDIMKTQPADLPHYEGERSQLLDSFCKYQKMINPPKDSNPDHWDMALYVSGLDFYAIENGRRSDVTMGLATVGGVCLDEYACVIAELGTTNVFGKPYPSAGFTSVYILAHEIGHNLGMHHDSSGNSCPKEGFIMSPSRGTLGETIWSSCSAEVMKKLSDFKCLMDKPGTVPEERNHNKFEDTPGQKWGAKKQCEMLLRDKDARVSPGNKDICQQLQCRTPHRSGYYLAGPALEGTDCGDGKWCQGGECVKMTKKKPGVIHGGWSNWKTGDCKSGCLVKGKGFLTKTRKCDNPKPVNTDEGCSGNPFEINLCKDDKVCGKKKRQAVGDYATKKCKEFSLHLQELDPTGAGLQAPHEDSRPWMACAVFCKRADVGMYYTPRLDLNDLGVDPYFPDGTWCHNDGKEDFYCIQHHCLPQSFKLSKLWGTLGEDVPFPGNARPKPSPFPMDIQRYLSLGTDGRPLLTSLQPGDDFGHSNEDDWTDHDYIEIKRP